MLRRGDGWALIDPDGLVGERAYDLGVSLRDACGQSEAAEEAERVTTGLFLRWHGYHERAEALLSTAAVLARSG